MYNSINAKINNEYIVSRENAENRHRQTVSKLMEQYPYLKEVENYINEEGLKLARYTLARDNENANHSKDRLHELKEQKDKFLRENGLYYKYYKIEYSCELCNDRGYLETDNKNKKCSCKIQKLLEKTSENQYMNLLIDFNFNNFREDLFSDEENEKKYGMKKSPRTKIIENRKISETFIENFHLSGEKNLLFSGQAGVGKTFLAGCIAEKVLKMGYTVLFQSSPLLFDLINRLKYNFSRQEQPDFTYDDLLNVNLLIIDDLGTESLTASKLAELLNILNIRSINNRTAPHRTIISTNITDMKIMKEHFDERIFSRIVGDFDLLYFAGDDLRIKSALSNKI